MFECFNIHSGDPQGHYLSADSLRARGVWLGYLAPEKHRQQYKYMPSFEELKYNYRNQMLPYPDVSILGSSSSNSFAACRGCIGGNSVPIELQQLSFARMPKTKNMFSVTAMPLQGEDGNTIFCILIPQKADRSIKGLEMLRPYEYNRVGTPNEPIIELLVARSFGMSGISNIVDFARSVLSAEELAQSAVPDFIRAASAQPTYALPSEELVRSLMIEDAEWRKQQEAILEIEEQSQQQSEAMHIDSGPVPLSGSQSMLKGKQAEGLADTVVKVEVASSPAKTIGPASSPGDDSSFTAYGVLPEDKGYKVTFVWPVVRNGMEYELVYDLATCATFADLLGQLRSDAESFACEAAVFAKTNMWCMTYTPPGQNEKRVIAVEGAEAAYSGLRDEAAMWASDRNRSIDVKLEPLAPGKN